VKAERGAEYALGDMSVLDVASLHWSKPRTVGRGSHSSTSQLNLSSICH